VLLGRNLWPQVVATAGNAAAATTFRRWKVKNQNVKLNFLGRSDARAFVNGPSFNCGGEIIIPLVNESFTVFQMRLLFANQGTTFYLCADILCRKV
jgi:hypothetical protein